MSISKSLDWRDYIDEYDHIELPKYIYISIWHLMKHALDLGTLLSEDDQRLRAYRDRIKVEFKERWFEIAEAMEYLGLIVPCGCAFDDYCSTCNGSRYLMDRSFSPDVMHEISTVVREDADDDVAIRLKQELASFLASWHEENDQ